MSRCWFALVALLFLPRTGGAAPAEQWIVVTAPAFRAAVEPLCEHRKAQGMQVVVVPVDEVLTAKEIRAVDAGKLRDRVHKLCREHTGPSYVLLVGATEVGNLPDAEKKVVPALQGTIGRMKGQPSDNGYGCLDEKRLPAVAVGRFPARDVDEVKAMVAKTLAYEKDVLPGEWRRRLTILAGIPAYNPFVDRVVEGLALARFGRLDPSWTGKAIYTNPQSRFSVPESRVQAQALQYVQDGQAFTLYLGHSNAEGLYAGRARFLDRDDWARLKIGRGAGVFLTFGCNGCQLKGNDGEGYGVAAMRNPGGPPAVLGSHGICFAAMVQLAADGVFESSFSAAPPERLSATWLALKKGLAQGKIDDLTYRMLDAVDGDDKIPQATQREEHLEMFVLLGDPALKLPAVASDVELKTAEAVAPGAALTVEGKVPARLAGAKVRLTLERTVNSEPADLEPLPADEGIGGKARDRVILANHERANQFVLASAEAVAREGKFEAKLDVPAKLPWRKLVLRVYAVTEREEGLAVLPLPVAR
jgi:hypothetical protein